MPNPKYPFLIPEETTYCTRFKKLDAIMNNTSDRLFILESNSIPVKLEVMADIPPEILITTEKEVNNNTKSLTINSDIKSKCDCKNCLNPSKSIPIMTKMFCSEDTTVESQTKMLAIEDIDINGYEAVDEHKIMDITKIDDYLSYFNIGEHLNEAERSEIESFLIEFRDRFYFPGEEIGTIEVWQHRIETEDHLLINERMYRTSYEEKKQIERMWLNI